jgi:hypothetical protein
MESEVAGLIAGWLHWYNRMPLQASDYGGCQPAETLASVAQGVILCAAACMLDIQMCPVRPQEAILSAEIAMGCSVDQALLETATEALVSSAEERQNKVVLTWKYGGLSASIAGEESIGVRNQWGKV